MGYSPWGRYKLDTTEQLHFHFSLSCIEEGNGNPLQNSCLENPRDGGAWWAAVYGVAQSWPRLKRLSSSSMDLTLQVPMQYCSLQHWSLLPSPVTYTTGCCFCFGSISSFFLELFLHCSLVASWAPTDLGSLSFCVLSFCLFIHGVLKAGILKWFAIPFSSEPRFVQTLHRDPSALGDPTRHGSWFH